MDVLTQIRKPVEREMKDFESLFGITLQHQNPLLMIALRHVLSRKGKLMRPILTLLAAKKYGEINDSVLHAAVSLEMLHTASLVHDDVVDESGVRRGQSSVNALLDNKAAVLVGDYLLSTALKHAAMAGDLRVVGLVARLGQTLSDGELQQLSNVKSDEISENQYFNVIRRKTASLFAVCAEVGALLSGASEDEIRRLGEFGTYVGICFQIRDDVFDYYDAEVGKPTGNDMKEGKLTLP
ncbi:polyprenyl synthetase family protein, partial [Paraprevotella clara]